MKQFDLIFVADARFEGGSSTALALEIVEAAQMGLTCGLLMVRGAIIRHPMLSHPQIRAALDRKLISRIDPDELVSAAAVVIHHPGVLTHPLHPRPRVLTGQTVLVLHHPLQDAAGKPQYDLERVVQHAAMAFGTKVILAPVSDVVRLGLPPQLPQGTCLTDTPWNNLIDLTDWPPRPPRRAADPVVLGRHARPDPKKWPDTADEAFGSLPTPDGWSVRILGGGPFLTQKFGHLPVKWHIEPFRTKGIAEWLGGLDFWVFFHASDWSEAFGRAIIEAMAVGVPVILHERMRPLFGPAATYCAAAEVEATIRAILAQDRWQELSDLGRAFVQRNHSAALFRPRILALLDAPLAAEALSAAACLDRQGAIAAQPERASHEAPQGGSGPLPGLLSAGHSDEPPCQKAFRQGKAAAPSTRTGLPRRSVLFLSSNGIGLGHLTQQIAVADRLPPDLTPVFASMSYAVSLARQSGYATEFIPHHRNGGLSPEAWNDHIAEVLFELLTRLRPSVVVYDATAAFDGILRALQNYRSAFTVWMRRPMWQEMHRPFLDALWAFDAVVEPGELAAELDHGPTTNQADWVLPLPPVLHLEPQHRLTRAAARELLDLPEASLAVALQLGGGNNYPLTDLRRRLIKGLLERGAAVIEFLSPIRSGSEDPPLEGPWHRQLRDFPQFRLSTGFDACVSMAGYNGFHEQLLGAVPTLFVPNEAAEMDLQVNRAIWAELSGCGLCLRRDHDAPRLGALLDRLLDPDEQARMRAACARLPQQRNGAAVLAEFIEDHARLVRADRNHGLRL